MAATVARSRLNVEGSDDKYSIANLVKAHGIDYEKNILAPRIEDVGSIDQLLEGMELAVQVSGERVIGFVMDADDSLADRWASVRQRLTNAGVENVPSQPPEDGYIGNSTRFKSRVGVWLMPDNLRGGALELFIKDLIDDNDFIIKHAEQSTDLAKSHGAKFKNKDRVKAIIHAWLSWQDVPGLPYGTAITAKYFRHDMPIAIRFVSWYSKLYRLTEE